MKSKKFLGFLATGIMLLGLAACGGKPATKYKVNYEAKPAEYSVVGINSDGYEANKVVSFTVTAASGRAIDTVKYDTTTLTPVEGSNYQFNMPAKDVTLSITSHVLDNYTLTANGTPKVDVEVTFILKNNDVLVTDDYTIEGKTAADKEYFTVDSQDATKLKFIKKTEGENKCTVVAKIGSDVKAELSFAVEKSDMVSIKEALDAGIIEAPCNGKSGNSGKRTTSSYKVGGQVVAIAKNSATAGYSGTILIDDGTEILPLLLYSGSTGLDKVDWKLGDSVTATVKLANYFGIMEGVAVASTDTKQSSLYPDQVTKIDKSYTPKTIETMDRAAFETYYALCATNGISGATAYTSVKYISASVTGQGLNSDNKLLYNIPGTGSSSGNLNIIQPEGDVVLEATKDVAYTTTGYLMGCNTNKNYGTYYGLTENDVQVTEWHYDVTEVQGFVGADTEVPFTIVKPAGARGQSILAGSDNPDICEYDGKKITGVAAGTTKIHMTIDGIEHELDVTIDAEPHPCTGLTIDPTSISGFVGGTAQITATPTSVVSPCTDKVTFKSDAEGVATVDASGNVSLVAEGSANITVKCGTYEQTCTVTVTGYGTDSNPLSIKTALALAAFECPVKDNVTKQVVTAKGVVTTAVDYSGSYIKQFTLKDETTTDTIIVFTCDKSQTVDCPDQNDTVVIKGYIKNYNGTIEFAGANQTNVALVANTRGTSTVEESGSNNASISDLSTTSGVNGTTFTFKASAESGYDLDCVTVNGVVVEAVEGVYTGTIHGNTKIAATGLIPGSKSVVAKYTDTSKTINMTGDGANNASLVNLDAEIFTVTAQTNTGTTTLCGLNKASYIALYCNAKSSDGGSVTFAVDGTKYKIITVTISWKLNKEYAKVTNSKGDVITATSGVYKLNDTSITIQDIANQAKSAQVQMYSITFVYAPVSE